MTTSSTALPLDRLRDALRDGPALPALSLEGYARTHAAFEAASDQRARLQEWMAEVLPALLPGRDPLRVVG
uniref:hypothetical protein n=1 Tax=Pseudonocardia pini TaxID=2758030 RepID=UPI0015EFE237